MPKFEYMTWVVAYANTNDGGDLKSWEGGVIRFVDGVEVANWKKAGARLNSALRMAGAQGWELVSVVVNRDSMHASDPTYIFKRPLPQ